MADDTGFAPKILICTECGEEFVFTGAAQQYFAERGYADDPKRCKSCHTRHKRVQRDPRAAHEPVRAPAEEEIPD